MPDKQASFCGRGPFVPLGAHHRQQRVDVGEAADPGHRIPRSQAHARAEPERDECHRRTVHDGLTDPDVPSGRGRCLLAILDVPGDSMSAVLLSARNGCFVKARVTFDATERHFGRMAHESMEAFVDAVRRGPTMAS